MPSIRLSYWLFVLPAIICILSLLPAAEGRDIFPDEEMANDPIVGVWLWYDESNVYFFPNATINVLDKNGEFTNPYAWWEKKDDSQYNLRAGVTNTILWIKTNGSGIKELWGYMEYPIYRGREDKPAQFGEWIGDI